MRREYSLRFIAGAYLRRRLKVIALFALYGSIYFLVFALCDIPIEAVLYGMMLAAAASAVIAMGDFWRYAARHRQLCDLLDQALTGFDRMPEPDDLIEADYQRMIEVLTKARMDLALQNDRTRTEMVDYYTLWAHQIKTPIAAMRLLLSANPQPRDTEISLKLLEIEQYVQMVLEYLRVSSDSSDLILKRYEVSGIVRQAVRKYAGLFILKSITLCFEEMPDQCLTDEKGLLFVIEQLLSNALKYTPSGGRIRIYMDPEQAGTLVIEDNGIGIRPEDLPRIFEKGFTGYNGRMDKKSTGIGLYLCRRIMDKLGHTIEVSSAVKRGTRVALNLYRDELEIMS